MKDKLFLLWFEYVKISWASNRDGQNALTPGVPTYFIHFSFGVELKNGFGSRHYFKNFLMVMFNITNLTFIWQAFEYLQIVILAYC